MKNMKTKRKSENLCFTVCDVILCFLIVFVSLNDVVNGGMANDKQKILSRRRRYLVFPEGSSFQVVYEIYQPIVDYSNLLIFYLTNAMAWELPYKAFHPEEHIQDLWDNVVFPKDQYDDMYTNSQDQEQSINQNTLQDDDNLVSNSNANLNSANLQNAQSQFQNKNQQGIQIPNRKEDPNNTSRIVDGYYSNNNYSSSPNKYYYSNYQNPTKLPVNTEPLTSVISNKMDYYLSYADNVLSQIADYATKDHTPWKQTDWTRNTGRQPISYQHRQANRRNYAQRQSRHFIHPAFGKRSTDSNNTPEEKFNLKYHRTTRQNIYRKIGKFLESDQVDGPECVLKALCETGKRRDTDKKPGPFLMEIMRVIFSLPDALDEEDHPHYSKYDDAHNAIMDCDEFFPKCQSSLWNKNLIFE